MEKDLLKIINNYGVLHQLKHFQSEVYELTEAIFDYEYIDKWGIDEIYENLKKHIAEEIADVEVMLLQFKEYYHIDGKDILEIMNQKIKRQLKRIEKEKENEL